MRFCCVYAGVVSDQLQSLLRIRDRFDIRFLFDLADQRFIDVQLRTIVYSQY